MRWVISIFLIVFILGCSTKYNLVKLDEFSKKEFVVEYDKKIARLFVSSQNGVYKFVMIDSLGVPLSSKKFENNKFANLKFLPPNSKFDKLFVEVSKMIKNNIKKDKFILENTEFKVLYVS